MTAIVNIVKGIALIGWYGVLAIIAFVILWVLIRLIWDTIF